MCTPCLRNACQKKKQWSSLVEHKRDKLVAVFRGVQRDRAEELQEELGAIEREAWSSDPTGWPG